jgi:hypothetical protein
MLTKGVKTSKKSTAAHVLAVLLVMVTLDCTFAGAAWLAAILLQHHQGACCTLFLVVATNRRKNSILQQQMTTTVPCQERPHMTAWHTAALTLHQQPAFCREAVRQIRLNQATAHSR